MAAAVLVLLALGLIASQGSSGQAGKEVPPIRMVVETTLLPPPPPPAPILQIPVLKSPQPKTDSPDRTTLLPERRDARPDPGSRQPTAQNNLPAASEPAPTAGTQAGLPPRPAGMEPSGPSTTGTTRDGPPDGAGGAGLSAGTRNTLRALECQRLAPEDRPPDCPAQGARLQADAAAAAGPQYRPENAQGFSRGEGDARFAAGLRDPCQTESGARAQNCIPIGPAPSRVRSPEEICRAQGLSNCVPLPKPVTP
ncbi:MAG: hypothetical protein MUF14_07650 [Hyphomonadaceae bacterium]|nr:hypothetical protein [Hyphomonadaceae bacterium]